MSLHRSVAATRLIHENLSIVMSFAYSQRPLQQMVEREFAGEWKYLHKALFEISEIRATRALVELATMIRVVDDAEQISERRRQLNSSESYGTVIQSDGSQTPLFIRDVTNKILHASEFSWRVYTDASPSVQCMPVNGDRWSSAIIDLRSLAAFCGQLMS